MAAWVVLGTPILLLWLLTWYGAVSLTPPGWIAALVTILPYVWILVVAVYALLAILYRTRRTIIVFLVLPVSSLMIWGYSIVPTKEAVPEGVQSLRVMIWNVQRMGQNTSMGNRTECIVSAVRKADPDILALLEITNHQLRKLQEHLGIPNQDVVWSDYYGTRRKGSGGLAICLRGKQGTWNVSKKRALNLPPDWKYLFLELKPKRAVVESAINVLALHVAPPKVSEREVKNTLNAIVRREEQASSQAWSLLQRYENQVRKQGQQVTDALRLIQTFRDPTIIAGDFNSTPDSALHHRLREDLVDTWSLAGSGFGATRRWGDFLPLRIDYIYVTSEFSVHDAQTLESDCSDHNPVVATLFID